MSDLYRHLVRCLACMLLLLILLLHKIYQHTLFPVTMSSTIKDYSVLPLITAYIYPGENEPPIETTIHYLPPGPLKPAQARAAPIAALPSIPHRLDLAFLPLVTPPLALHACMFGHSHLIKMLANQTVGFPLCGKRYCVAEAD